MTVERLITLEGAVNFRDLGGYATVDDRRTRWRVLFRADGLSELTEADLAVVRELGIRTVIDLRSAHEVEISRFNVEAHPVSFHHYPLVKVLPDVEEFTRAPGFLGAHYKVMLDGATPEIVAVLTALAEPDAQPAVFHCTAGKDRTGLIAALVLSLLGVPEETVVADYALSGAAMTRLRAKLIEKYPEGTFFINQSDEGVFGADPANMVGLFAHLRQRYGSVAAYAAEIGVPDAVVAELRRTVLEPLPTESG